MCQSEHASRAVKIERQSSLDVVELAKRKLNPTALNFISSRSSSEVNSPEASPASEAGSEEGQSADLLTSQGGPTHPENTYYNGPSYDEGSGHHHIEYAHWGWESPQGVLPSSPPYTMSSAPHPPHAMYPYPSHPSINGQGDTNGPPRNGAGSPPPHYPAHAYHPNLGVNHHGAAYYHNAPIDASPPAMVNYPSGSSPPVAPGFISIPAMPPPHPHGSSPVHQHGPHPVMYGTASPPHSMGSSPPGATHYYVMHSFHPHGHSPPQHEGHLVDHMGALSVNSYSGHSTGTAPPGFSNDGSGGRRSAGDARASARIARSHRAGGLYNPSQFKFDVVEAEAGGQDARTTVMLRHIPNKYSQSAMIEILDKAGFKGTYNFFYLPIDFRTRSGLGYLFINFESSIDAARLYHEYNGKRWDEFNSKKVCEVTYGRVQGRDALVQHFRAAKFPSDDAAFQPVVLRRGQKGLEDPLPIHAFLAAEALAGEEAERDGEA